MNATCEWWEEFFRGPWGQWQAQGFRQDRSGTEVDLLVNALKLKKGEKVLDIACGVGRHAVELAARGFDVTGIDFNKSVIAAARQRVARRRVAAEFLELDMRCLRYRDRFDAAYCFWTSFGYFEDESHDLVVAKRIAEALRPGGRFLLEVDSTETVLPMLKARRREWLDDNETCELLHETQWNFETSRIEEDWTFVENGKSESRHSSLRLYSYRELCDLLREAGFQHFEGFDTLTGEPFSLGSSRLALVASL